MGPVSAFLVFFAVFYCSQCYARFFAQYNVSMSCEGRIYDTVMMALAYMERPAAIQLMRYLSAAHALGYIGLGSSHYAMGDSFFLMINEQHQLLTPKELDVVMAIGPSKGGTAYRTVLTWATMFVRENIPQELWMWPGFNSQICRLRGAIGTLYDYDAQPTPFAYWNMLIWIQFFYCPVMAFVVAVYCAHDYWPLG